jgi:DNA-directed RNA polymerase specialized sigma24 family protein
MVETEEAAIIVRALHHLGEPCRKLLVLFYWEEYSMDEIASQLGFANAETAKSKKYQCKKALEILLRGARND